MEGALSSGARARSCPSSSLGMPLSSKLLLRRSGWPTRGHPRRAKQSFAPKCVTKQSLGTSVALSPPYCLPQCSVALPNERLKSCPIAVENIVIHETIDPGHAFLFGVLPEVPGGVVGDARC